MKTKIEIRAEVLMRLMIEDRQEIRGIRSAIYNVVTLLSTASFAITSFLLAQEFDQTSLMCLVTDGLIVLLLWVFFVRLKRDLYCCRQCLVARQDLIRDLGTESEPQDLDPFPDARNQTPDVSDSELWWLPVLATVAIAIKSLVIWFLSS
jgi:hypothetical protein